VVAVLALLILELLHLVQQIQVQAAEQLVKQLQAVMVVQQVMVDLV
jgi:hypothetical protein